MTVDFEYNPVPEGFDPWVRFGSKNSLTGSLKTGRSKPWSPLLGRSSQPKCGGTSKPLPTKRALGIGCYGGAQHAVERPGQVSQVERSYSWMTPPRTSWRSAGINLVLLSRVVVLLPVAAGAELFDQPGTAGLPAELGSCPGRSGALVEQQHLREVIAETRASFLVGTGDGARCARSDGGCLCEFRDRRDEPVPDHVGPAC